MASTATQIIPGAFRETNNPLLLKAEIGKPLLRGFALPMQDFTYGKTSNGKFVGASDAFNWRNKQIAEPKMTAHNNYILMNKSATKNGLVTTNEQLQYRSTHDVPLVKCGAADKSHRQTRTDLPPIYGVPTKPSTPVFDLLEHKYQDAWLQEQQCVKPDHHQHEERRAMNGYSETRASRLRRYSLPVDPPALWQMSKFQKKALPALVTFRSEKARKKAFRDHQTDCTSRTGVFGHGIYEGAKS